MPTLASPSHTSGNSGQLSIISATTSPGLRPSASAACATRFAASFSCAKLSVRPSNTMNGSAPASTARSSSMSATLYAWSRR